MHVHEHVYNCNRQYLYMLNFEIMISNIVKKIDVNAAVLIC